MADGVEVLAVAFVFLAVFEAIGLFLVYQQRRATERVLLDLESKKKKLAEDAASLQKQLTKSSDEVNDVRRLLGDVQKDVEGIRSAMPRLEGLLREHSGRLENLKERVSSAEDHTGTLTKKLVEVEKLAAYAREYAHEHALLGSKV